MRIARPTDQSFEDIYDFLNWLAEELEKDVPDTEEVKQRLERVDHKVRHVLLVASSMIEQCCTNDATLSYKPSVGIAVELEDSLKTETFETFSDI